MNTNTKTILLPVSSLLMLAGSAAADTWPQTIGDMVHVEVALDGSAIQIAPLHDHYLNLYNFGDSHTPPADVLDGKGYNDQYGWVATGFWDLPNDAAIWIELLDQTIGLDAYEGGRRLQKETHTYAPIFTTDGSTAIWQWDGMMWHHWFAASEPGDYEATYRVYVGDALGQPLPGYASDDVTLSWTYVPGPGSIATLGMASLVFARRRS